MTPLDHSALSYKDLVKLFQQHTVKKVTLQDDIDKAYDEAMGSCVFVSNSPTVIDGPMKLSPKMQIFSDLSLEKVELQKVIDSLFNEIEKRGLPSKKH